MFLAASLRHAERCMEILPPARFSFRPGKIHLPFFHVNYFPLIFDHWFGLPQSSVAEHTRTQKTIQTGRSVTGIFLRGRVVGLILGVPPSAGGGDRGDPAVPGPARLLAPLQGHDRIASSPCGQRKRATAPRSASGPGGVVGDHAGGLPRPGQHHLGRSRRRAR